MTDKYINTYRLSTYIRNLDVAKNHIQEQLPYEWAQKKRNLNNIINAVGCDVILKMLKETPESFPEDIENCCLNIMQLNEEFWEKSSQEIQKKLEIRKREHEEEAYISNLIKRIDFKEIDM